jgi:hypothetical protein
MISAKAAEQGLAFPPAKKLPRMPSPHLICRNQRPSANLAQYESIVICVAYDFTFDNGASLSP